MRYGKAGNAQCKRHAEEATACTPANCGSVFSLGKITCKGSIVQNLDSKRSLYRTGLNMYCTVYCRAVRNNCTVYWTKSLEIFTQTRLALFDLNRKQK